MSTKKPYKTQKPEDPRVTAFKRAYMDATNPKTFCNIRQSALIAGYSEQYAENISGRKRPPKWWLEFRDSQEALRAEMLKMSEQHFYKVLQTPDDTNDGDRYKLKQRTAEFVSERVGKEVYSTRQEVTGADGRRLFDSSKRERATVPLSKLFKPAPQSPTE